jgi:hypothetical protein
MNFSMSYASVCVFWSHVFGLRFRTVCVYSLDMLSPLAFWRYCVYNVLCVRVLLFKCLCFKYVAIYLYTSIYNSWYNTEYFIFGHGNQGDSYRTQGRRTHAHSDIFGFMYNFGTFGLVLLAILYIKVIRFFFAVKINQQNNRYSVLAFLAVLFLVNLYSGLFYITETIYLFSFLPYMQIDSMTTSSN